MAVFIASSDEIEIGGHRGMFMHSGLLAPENDWSEYFAPAWEERVLFAPPAIPYLHVVELRDRKWQKANDVSLSDAEINVKLDEAVDVIMQMGSLVAAGTRINAGAFLDSFGKKKIVKMAVSDKPQRLLVDHLSFFGHVFCVLNYVDKHYPDAEKVDFLVDRKHGVFDRLSEYYETLAACLHAIGEGTLPRLLGKLIPGGPDTRVPLQAADAVLWHVNRSYRPQLTREDYWRLKKLKHLPESITHLPDDAVRELATVFMAKLDEQRISELQTPDSTTVSAPDCRVDLVRSSKPRLGKKEPSTCPSKAIR